MAESGHQIAVAGTGNNVAVDVDTAGFERQIVQVGDAGSAKMHVGTGGDTYSTLTSPNAAALGIFANLQPYGTLRVSAEPSALFMDPFDGSTIDTNRWTAAGTQVPTQANGQVSLAPTIGASVNNNSTLISVPTFTSPGVGFVIFGDTVTLEAAQTSVVNVHRFWGKGQVTSYTYSTPITDGVGFEVEGALGALQCVVYIAGTRYVINSSTVANITSTLNGLVAGGTPAGTALPSGAVASAYGAPLTWQGGQHRYALMIRSDIIFWFVEGSEKPVAVLSYASPNVQGLPIRFAAITNGSATSLANTFTIGATAVNDSTGGNTQISDGTYPHRKTKVGSGGDLSVSLTTPATTTNPTPAFASIFGPSQELRVAMEGTQIFLDSFDSGLDTLNVWKTPTVGGTGVAATSVAGSGGTTLSSGTTSNSFSRLESIPTFAATDPGWLFQRINLNIEFAVLTTGYRFWGRAQTPTSPTIATPLNEAVGWEIRTDGKLYAVMAASGANTFAQDLSVATGSGKQPQNSSAHDYMIWFKGNYMYWAIDSPDNIVAIQTTGANGPNYNNMPVTLLCVSNSGTAVTQSINSIMLGDTGRNGSANVDARFPWKKAVVEDGGAARVTSGIPSIIQKKSAVSTGSVASLTTVFDAINTNGNSIVVVCAVGNGTTPTVTDSIGNPYLLATNVANGTAFNTAIYYAPNVFSGSRNTITVTNGGTTASIAMTAYEMDAMLGFPVAAVDKTLTATGTSTTPATAAISTVSANDYFFAAIGVGTAAQTITPATGWSNDSGQLNPTTPAGLFSFASISQFGGGATSLTPSSTIVSEPWAVCAVAFRPVLMGVQGAVRITDGTTNAAVKPNSTAAVATDTALVVAVSPNNSVAVTLAANNPIATPVAPTAFLLNSAATTNATSIKASSAKLFQVTASNQTAAAKFVKIFNKASAPTVGTDLAALTISLPAQSATVSNVVVVNLGALGMLLSTGLALSITGAVADSDATAVALGDVKVIVSYI